MRASGELLCFVGITLCGCATVQRQGPRLKVEPLEHHCVDTHLSGRLTPEGDALKLTIVADATCSTGEVDTFTTERYAQSWVPATMLGVGAGALVATPLLVGIGFMLDASASQPPAGTEGGLMMLGVLPGLAVGTAVAYAVGKSEARLPDGKPERVERVMTSETITRAPSGVLRPDTDQVHHWQVQDGVVLLPLADVQPLNLKRLLLEGQLVEFADSSSQALADSLDACRVAEKGWRAGASLTCEDARRRLEATERCRQGGWMPTPELSAALQQAVAKCP